VSQTNIFQALRDLRARSAEAIISQSGLNHEGLAAEIRRRFAGEDVAEGALLQQAVIEAAPAYVEAPQTLGQLSGSLLAAETVAALDGSADPRADRYRFKKEWRPYTHQLEAWGHIKEAGAPRSVLVTSGTGSGKTECFLVPIIDDLARQSSSGKLVGVQAVVLYPLNALIASQEERLRDWTAPFKGRIRFALYNGMLEEERPAHQTDPRPEAVLDRKTLRDAPPPILVTNVTMLEYMLLRKEDAPILAQSQGKLRYIVLDEAHSYVGAQAAEIAMLLRRVCLAFGVVPADVRFIATSATIGSSDAKQELQKFLSDVAGVPPAQVIVVEGKQRWPELPPSEDISVADVLQEPASPDCYDTLAKAKVIRPLLEQLRKGPTSLSFAAAVASRAGVGADDLLLGVSAASKDGEPLSPLRVHSFHRAVGGVWTCLNAACTGRRAKDWPYGGLTTDDVELCGCGSPTFEVTLCTACGEPFVEVLERGDGMLGRCGRPVAADEYALEAEASEGDEDDTDEAEVDSSGGERHRLTVGSFPATRLLYVDQAGKQVFDGAGDDRRRLPRFSGADDRSCAACGATRKPGEAPLIRSFRFGAPSVLQNATPVLLESASACDGGQPPQSVPSGGRQLLSFTDSRQGTARFSAKLQIGSERNFVRSFIYHTVQAELAQRPDTSRLEDEIRQLEPLAEAIGPLLEQKKAEREALLAGAGSGLKWEDLRSRLARRIEVQSWILDVWSKRPKGYRDPDTLANFLLLREFFRRPRRAVSVETLGLARLAFDPIDDLPDARTPASFIELGGTAEDWRTYLQVLTTWLWRENAAVSVSRADRNWIQPRAFSAEYVRRVEDKVERWHKLWPVPAKPDQPVGRASRALILLTQAFNCSLDDPKSRDLVADCLSTAWLQLQAVTSTADGSRRQLDIDKGRVRPVRQAWFCPITRRLLDATFKGLTPYGATSLKASGRKAPLMRLPEHPLPFLGADKGMDPEQGHEVVQEWLQSSPEVATLREQGAWTDLNDRAALFSSYFRSAEHSAQQTSERLRRYEGAFKRGDINVLNCSTTMEMGVDIGSVSHVMMTNVPPSLASYRQRIGRAGRRRQALSLGFTFCKDRPLDRATFADPIEFLNRTVAAPKVALNSEVIVQRHVNALVFGDFVRRQSGDAMKMKAGAFFGCGSAAGAAEVTKNPALLLADYAELPSTAQSLKPALARLLAKTCLEGDPDVLTRTAQQMREIREAFRSEWAALQQTRAAGGDPNSAMARGLAIQLRRMCDAYLLGALGERGFLPSHGFPSGVVPFLCKSEERKPEEDQEDRRRPAFPQRQLDVAIREYAPGSELVIDGLVHRSAGITLNWQRPATPEGVREIQSLKWRGICLDCGEAGGAGPQRSAGCVGCGSERLAGFEYLEPAGFAADFNEDVHADPDIVAHVPAEAPVVTVPELDWKHLTNPFSGRHRGSRQGRVFFCNAGPEREGYRLCLYCGRAEPAGQDDGEGAESLGWSHRPLLAKPTTDGLCPGSAQPFTVRPSLRLGFELVTDAFELQLAGLSDEGAGIALTVALREALARRLGVDASEMGLAVQVRAGVFGRKPSLFLFDKASGGAGFAIQASDRLSEMFHDATHILDCRVPGCVRGCPACVLVGDLTDDQVDKLDRQSALQLVKALVADTAPDVIDRLTPDARLTSSVVDVIDREVRAHGDAVVRLQVGPDLDPTEFANWAMATMAADWRRLGRRVVVCVSAGDLDRLDGAAKLSLRDALTHWGVELEAGDFPPLSNEAVVLAEATTKQGIVQIVSRDRQCLEGSRCWGRVVDAPLVLIEGQAARLVGTSVPVATLKPGAGAVVRTLKEDLDGDMDTFGQRAAELLQAMLHEAGASQTPIESITYNDRYLRSPLATKLALETFSSLAGAKAEREVPVKLLVADPWSRGPTSQLWHDWPSSDEREATQTAFGEGLGLKIEFGSKAPAHGRLLAIQYEDGRLASVWLDQGFGPWAAEDVGKFPFHQPAAQQAAALKRTKGVVVARAGGSYMVARVSQ
jgi:DEAD/DEAH box helicase domain-containing protein